MRMPDSFKFKEEAALPMTFTTAYHMLVDRAATKPEETVLVLGAGSGIGSAAIQVASLLGAKVIATSLTEDKLKKAQRIGAELLDDLGGVLVVPLGLADLVPRLVQAPTADHNVLPG